MSFSPVSIINTSPLPKPWAIRCFLCMLFAFVGWALNTSAFTLKGCANPAAFRFFLREASQLIVAPAAGFQVQCFSSSRLRALVSAQRLSPADAVDDLPWETWGRSVLRGSECKFSWPWGWAFLLHGETAAQMSPSVESESRVVHVSSTCDSLTHRKGARCVCRSPMISYSTISSETGSPPRMFTAWHGGPMSSTPARFNSCPAVSSAAFYRVPADSGAGSEVGLPECPGGLSHSPSQGQRHL